VPRESPDARRSILDASIALVAEQGVRAVSFREVARRAGVSHQTPYHHFGDHLGILREIAREGFAALTAAMQEAADREKDAQKALYASGIAYVKFARSHVGHFRVMFQGSSLMPAESARLEEADGTYATLVRLAAAAHRAGAGRGLSVEAVSHVAWSTVHGLSVLLIEGTLQSKDPRASDDAIVRQVVGALGKLLDNGRT
jgi:AcrR family transcriptional regulator